MAKIFLLVELSPEFFRYRARPDADAPPFREFGHSGQALEARGRQEGILRFGNFQQVVMQRLLGHNRFGPPSYCDGLKCFVRRNVDN
jgi:hypothetical protein